MSIFYNETLLDKLSFDLETSTFTLFSKDQPDSFSVSYIPKKVTAEYDISNYELYVLENNSLIAENDIFLVHECVLKKGIGWIFPLAALESNENDYAEKEFFNQFRFLAYQKILANSFSLKKEITEKKESFLLSDLFDNDLIILIISKSEFSGENIFAINNYLPSLAIHGYFIKNEHELKYICPNDYITKKFRGSKKIKISPAKNPVYQSNYAKKLYQNYLKSLDHHLIRFHLLYQIIENHINELFNTDFERLLEQYNTNIITKNNFIEEINKVRNERQSIRKVFQNLNPNDDTFEKSALINLKRDCKAFLDEFGVDERNEIGDILYDVRNIIVHNYRGVEDKNIQLLDEVTFEFEILISHLMINSP